MTAGPGSRGEYSFKVGAREIGHLHGDRVAHFGFPKDVWHELYDAGRIDYHPVFPGKPGFGARAIAQRGRRARRDRADAAQLRPRGRRHGLPLVRAVWLREFGPPSALEPGEAPEPDGDVVIDVAYANITFVETQVRAGRGPFPVTLPMIPGNGVGGYLDGRRVVASLGGSGGYAERAVGADVFDVPDAPHARGGGRAARRRPHGDDARRRGRDRSPASASSSSPPRAASARCSSSSPRPPARTSSPPRAPTPSATSPARSAPTTPYGIRADSARRFDVVFDGVGGAVARDAFERLAPGGRMLSFGLASGVVGGRERRRRPRRAA